MKKYPKEFFGRCVNYVKDYFVRLDRKNPEKIYVDVAMSQPVAGEKVKVEIPELKKSLEGVTDAAGRFAGKITARNLRRWAPDAPVLYDVKVTGGADTVTDRIGFRNIDIDGTKILVNGKPVFMRCVSFHEEIPQRMGRAFSKADAAMLLGEARDLGVNMVRLAHYPQNEYTVSRSPFRFHPTNQEGWNRKGLVSDRGQRKKAWYIMHDFYNSKR